MSGHDLGDLAPFRELVQELNEWERQDRERRPDGDPVVHAVRLVRRRLEAAMAAASDPQLEVDVEEYARIHGLTPASVYKRIQRGRLPVRRRGVRIRIPVTGAQTQSPRQHR